jgi:hypothetical protein
VTVLAYTHKLMFLLAALYKIPQDRTPERKQKLTLLRKGTPKEPKVSVG